MKSSSLPAKPLPITSSSQISSANKDLRPLFTFKLILTGESSVGKTSIISSSSNQSFLSKYQPTVCFEYFWLNYSINNSILRLQIWDTCGQEIYQSLIRNFYHSAHIAFLVFALNDRNSFDKLDNWYKEIREVRGDDLILFLVGNKVDEKERDLISNEEIQEFVRKYDVKFYWETSAKTGEGVDVVFKEAVKVLYNELIVNGEVEWEMRSLGGSGVVELSQPKKDSKVCKECLCCGQ